MLSSGSCEGVTRKKKKGAELGARALADFIPAPSSDVLFGLEEGGGEEGFEVGSNSNFGMGRGVGEEVLVFGSREVTKLLACFFFLFAGVKRVDPYPFCGWMTDRKRKRRC